VGAGDRRPGSGGPGGSRERAHRRAEEPVRGGRVLSEPAGEPELRELQRELAATEDRVAYARQYY
jgi:hypothetical protein